MKQIYVESNSLCFYKDNGYLVLSDWFSKTWFPVDSTDGFKLGLQEVSESQLNQLRITFQDESRLQCVVFCRSLAENHHFSTKEYFKEQLEAMTGHKVVFKRNFGWLGRIQNPYIPLRDDLAYKDLFFPYNQFRNFTVGSNIASITFQNGSPTKLNKRIETLIITDSYLLDLEFLNDLPCLKSLVIERSVIFDPTALGSLKQLTHLYLETLDLANSSLFFGLTQLISLGIVDCGLAEIEGLRTKPFLTYCDISSNPIKDLSPLSDSTNLQWLACEDTFIEELDVCPWKQLKVLEMKGVWSEDLKNLDQCCDLKILDFSNTELIEEALIEIAYLVEANGLFAFDWYHDIKLIDCPITTDKLDRFLS